MPIVGSGNDVHIEYSIPEEIKSKLRFDSLQEKIQIKSSPAKEKIKKI